MRIVANAISQRLKPKNPFAHRTARFKPRPFKTEGFIVGCLVFLATAACLPALSQLAPQAPPRPIHSATGLYRIAGTVVNAVTGEPVRRATVAVLAEANSHTVKSVESGSDGRFSLEGLPAAKYQLTASKRGFRTAFYDEHEEFSTAIVTGDGQETGNLTFRLTPNAVLHGVVTTDGGDPVENAQVMLFLKPHGHKQGESTFQVEQASTDDTGAYEFANLAAGEYLLAVKAEPWYALHRAANRSRSGGEVSAALDVAYPVTYYDSTVDEASATSILLAGGSHEEANINLHAVPALHLVVETPHKPNASSPRPELRQTIFGAQFSPEGVGFLDSSPAGASEFTGVAPGHYELSQGDPPRVADLEASASEQIDPSLGAPTVAISATLRTASGAAPVETVPLTLESLDEAPRIVPLQAPSRPGGASTAAAPPGDWKLLASSSEKPWQILSLAVNGKTTAGNLLTVRDRPLSIVVWVSESATRIEGFARKDGKGVSGVMMVLVPRHPAANQDLFRRDQSDSDGSFALRDVAPGAYTVVAIEDGWELDWRRPEILDRYLSKGIAVTITDKSGNRVNLSTPVPVQPR
jgi:hypothetical protein